MANGVHTHVSPTPIILTNYRWLQIDEHCSWHMFTGTRFTEKGVE